MVSVFYHHQNFSDASAVAQAGGGGAARSVPVAVFCDASPVAWAGVGSTLSTEFFHGTVGGGILKQNK